jgi:peptidoglycan/LPS O-acetylase OafA/YrhL
MMTRPVAEQRNAALTGMADAHRLPYRPALDGLRAIAVIAVLLFHSGFRWARGGFLGVTAFFVLSGFLIGGGLLAESDARGRIDLRRFWTRRARRLVPAALIVISLVLLLASVSRRGMGSGLFGDGVASLGWLANWRFVLSHRSYAGLFAGPSPFQHMWSVAVEEQFYVFLPLLIVAFSWLRRGRRAGSRRYLAAAVLALIATSTYLMSALHPSGAAAGRAYYGTDARMAEPLVGVLLALILVQRGVIIRLHRALQALADVVGVAALATLAFLCARMTERSDFLYRGGFLLVAVLSALVVVALSQPNSVLGMTMSARPLVALGRISYGVYLFHWPIFVWLTTARTGWTGWSLITARCGATVVLAVVSYALVEQPIRRGALPARPGLIAWANSAVVLAACLSLVGEPPSVLASALGNGHAALAPPIPVAMSAPAMQQPAPPPPTTTVPRLPTKGQSAVVAPIAHQRTITPTTIASPAPVAPSAPPRLRVAIVGDSMAQTLSLGLADWAHAQGSVVTYDLSIQGCPLSRGGTRRLADGSEAQVGPDCGWWDDPSSDRFQKFDEFDPDVVVVHDGLNELYDRKLPQWPDYRHAGESAFDLWLDGEYRALLQRLGSKRQILVLNAACADWELMGGPFAGYADNSDGDRRVSALDEDAVPLASTNVQVEDFDSTICPNGKFTQSVEGVSDARPDGYHLSTAASDAVATHWLGPLILQTAGSPSVN